MRKFLFPRITTLLVSIFMLQLATCSGGGGGGGSTSGGSPFQNSLRDFNTQSGKINNDATSIFGQAISLKSALDRGDTASVDSIISEQAASISDLLKQVENMGLTEASIEGLIRSGARQSDNVREKELVLALAGAAIVLYGLHGFATSMSGYNDRANAARNKRDQAAANINDNVPGAIGDYNNAVDDMQAVGEEVIVELATKVVADQLTSLVPAESVAGLILTDQAGNKIQDALKVLSATRECKDGYSTTKCKIGIDETDSDGKVTVPAGDIIIIITGDGSARIVVDPVTTTAGGTTTVVREAIPISNATATNVAANDAGTYTPGGDSGGDTDTGGGSDTGGSSPLDNGEKWTYSGRGTAVSLSHSSGARCETNQALVRLTLNPSGVATMNISQYSHAIGSSRTCETASSGFLYTYNGVFDRSGTFTVVENNATGPVTIQYTNDFASGEGTVTGEWFTFTTVFNINRD